MWESRLYPQPKQILDLATPEGCEDELTYVAWKRTGRESNRDLPVASPTPYRSATTQQNRVPESLPLFRHTERRTGRQHCWLTADPWRGGRLEGTGCYCWTTADSSHAATGWAETTPRQNQLHRTCQQWPSKIIQRLFVSILISKALRVAHVDEGSHSFTRLSTNGMNHPAFDLRPHSTSSHFGRYSFSVPQRVGGWVGLGGWLHTEVVLWPPEGSPITVPTDR